MTDGSGLSEILAAAEERCAAGQGVVIAVLVRAADGSPVPRRMLIAQDGARQGSIHPALDSIAASDALSALAERRSRLRSYRIVGDSAEPARLQAGDADVFYDVLSRPPRLIIAGAGHIAQPLAALAHILDFEVAVLDDRAEYATRDRFPAVNEILIGPYRATLASMMIGGDTHIVLVTRGHVHDQACLEAVLDSPAAYIGMIGSKRRVRTVLDHLRVEGRSAERLGRIRAPIGLDIGARTPAEIALAIMAEIVQVRQGGSGRPLSGDG